MRHSEAIFKQISTSFPKYLFESIVNGKDERTSNVVVLMSLALLAYAGVETTQLAFRRNFGKKGVSPTRFVLSSIAFFVIAWFAYSFHTGKFIGDWWGAQSSFLFTAIFYLILGLYTLITGIIAASKDNPNVFDEFYRGDSFLLSFLVAGGWKPSLIQNLAEPLLLFAIGVFFLPYSLLLGLPLVFCAISTWLHAGLEFYLEVGEERNRFANEGHLYSKNRKFSKIIE